MSDYDVLSRLYRRACDTTGRKPYVFIISRPFRLAGEARVELLRGEDGFWTAVKVLGIPVVLVPSKRQPPVAVARVEMSRSEKDSMPTSFPADWSELDYCFEIELEESEP